MEMCTMHEPNEEDRWGAENPNLKGLHKFHDKKGLQVGACYNQHLPPNLLPEVYGKGTGRETFCSVRHPYDKMLSQFGHAAKFFPFNWQCDRDNLNRYLMQKLTWTKDLPWTGDCHFLPQASYVWGWDEASFRVDLSVRHCQHVLRHETLNEDFDSLMKAKGYPYRLSTWATNRTSTLKQCKTLRRSDINATVMRLIHDIYHDDFELLNYTRSTGMDSISLIGQHKVETTTLVLR